MVAPRKQPSGSYQGIAVHPSGKRHTRTFPLRRQAQAWSEELEATWRRDGAFDPRAGEQTAGRWLQTWGAARRVDPVTADKEASHLRNHIRVKWADWPLASMRRLDVQTWVKDMERAGVGAHTIVACVRLLSTALRDAVDEGLLATNPVSRIAMPTPPAKPPFFWTREQAALIIAAMPGQWRVAVDLDFHVGLRLGELLGLRVGSVDWARAQIHVTGVMTRHGWRHHPKSSRSQRTVPIPGRLLNDLAPLVLGRDPEAIVFAGRGGKPVGDTNFRNRAWGPALARAGACARHLERDQAASRDCEDCRPVPAGSPHDARHTAASWLVMDGIDLYRVQELLGHESFQTTQRYSHLAPDAHDKIRESWRRTGVDAPSEAP